MSCSLVALNPANSVRHSLIWAVCCSLMSVSKSVISFGKWRVGMFSLLFVMAYMRWLAHISRRKRGNVSFFLHEITRFIKNEAFLIVSLMITVNTIKKNLKPYVLHFNITKSNILLIVSF